MNQLQLNINKAVMEKYGALSPETNFLGELYQKIRDLEAIPDRRTIYSIEVTDNLGGQKNKHWRWAGTLEQFEKDVKEYIGSCEGEYNFLSANKIEWRSKKVFGQKQDITLFHAVKYNSY
jgi:CRISPR/Cas system-associated protein Cas7 (RAMP superfamily)